MLLIEVDGRQHAWQMDEDNARDARLKQLGYETLRISHYNVMTDLINVSRNIEAKVIEIQVAKELTPKF